MINVTRVKKQTSESGAFQVIVETDEPTPRYFCVSGVNPFGFGWEVLVFPCDSTGEVTDYGEVAGGRGMTHDEAIADLLDYLNS